MLPRVLTWDTGRENFGGEIGIFWGCLGVLSALNLQINRLKHTFHTRKT